MPNVGLRFLICLMKNVDSLNDLNCIHHNNHDLSKKRYIRFIFFKKNKMENYEYDISLTGVAFGTWI